MFTRKQARQQTAPVPAPVREFTFYYRGAYRAVFAPNVQAARAQYRAETSAQADREAILTAVK